MPAFCHRIFIKSWSAILFLATFILFASDNVAIAQTCSGSLGDAFVNFGFGSGAGVGYPLNAATTNLTYATGCPAAGQYAIVNSNYGCNNDWQTVIQDHTGNTSGYYGWFMLINTAANTPANFYVQQIDGLCPGTTYQLSAALLNMAKTTGADPNVIFSIEQTDGTVITSNAVSVPKTTDAGWQDYSSTFSLPPGITSIVIRIHNAATGPGYALALDDITLRAVGPLITINVPGYSGIPITVCQNSPSPTLVANVGNCYTNTTYQWQVYKADAFSPAWVNVTSNGNSPTYTVSTANSGQFQYRLLVADNGNIQSQNCRVVSAPLAINVAPTQQAIVNIENPKTNVCLGEKVTFNTYASNVGQGVPVYDWQINGVSVNVNSNTYSTKALLDGDVVTCTLTDAGTCAVPGISQSIKMHVNGLAPNININATATSICSGTPVTFNVSTNQTTGISYDWQINGVTTNQTGFAFTSPTLKNGDKVLCMVGSSTCSTPVPSDEIVMTVSDATLSASITTPITTICPNTSVTFNASQAAGASYQWQINNVNVGTNNSAFTTSNIHDADNVTCQLSNNLCATPVTSNSITMHVAGPITSGSISTPAQNICLGQSATFTATTGNVTGTTYQWLVNGVNAGVNMGTFTPTTLNNNDVVSCLISSSAGCSTPFTTNSITVHVAPGIASLTISPSVNNVCEGTPVTFTADQTSAASYQWKVNNTNVGASMPTYTATDLNDGDVVTCTLISNSSCTTPVPSNSFQMQIITPLKSVAITPTATTICKGSSVTFSAIVDQKTGTTYQWLVNSQPVTAATSDTFVTSDLKNNDAVTCQVTSVANCNPPTTPNPFVITVTDPPQITLPATAYQINKGESVDIAASAVGSGLTYQWSPATGLVDANMANPTASPATTTKYTLLVTNPSGCMVSSAPVTVTVVIKDIKVPNSFTPNNDGINDTWVIPGLDNDPTAKVRVYNRYGALVYNSIGYNTPWNGNYKSKILPTGVYYYTISLTNNTRKLSGFVAIIR